MRFNFVAKVDANLDGNAKVPFIRTINTDRAHGMSMNITAVAEQNNRAFLEMAGFKNDTILSFDNDRNKIEIDWDDRKDPDVIKSVASFRKYVITLNEERHEFITEYDFIEFVRDHIDEIKGKDFIITGQIRKNEYNSKISDRFQIQNMFEVTDDRKHQFRVSGEFFWNAEGIDTADWKSEKKVIINGYTKEWMDKNHPNAYVPMQIIFDASKINFENEGHIKLLKFKLAQIGLEYENGKINNKLKKNAYFSQSVICNYINGNEKIEFDESQLTENQKLALELGLKTIDDFRPSGSIYGDRITILKLVDFDMRGDYADGYVKLDEKPSEFEELIYSSAKEESEDDLDELPFMNPPKQENDDEDVDDLFG